MKRQPGRLLAAGVCGVLLISARGSAQTASPKNDPTALIYYKKQDKGTHFAAWEQPAALVADLRAAFKSLR